MVPPRRIGALWSAKDKKVFIGREYSVALDIASVNLNVRQHGETAGSDRDGRAKTA